MSNTSVIEARVDLRDLAVCARYFTEKGMMPRTKSELLHTIISTFAELAKKQGIEAFEGTEDALGYMYTINLGPVNRIKRSGERRGNVLTLAKAIADERLLETTIMQALKVDKNTMPEDEVMKAMEILNNLKDDTFQSTFENRTKGETE